MYCEDGPMAACSCLCTEVERETRAAGGLDDPAEE